MHVYCHKIQSYLHQNDAPTFFINYTNVPKHSWCHIASLVKYRALHTRVRMQEHTHARTHARTHKHAHKLSL